MHHAVFRIPKSSPLLIEKDIQLRIFHTCHNEGGTGGLGNAAANDQSPSSPLKLKSPTHVITMVNFSFHTGFMPSGLIRVRAHDLDLLKRDVDNGRFPADFSIDLMVSETVSLEEANSNSAIDKLYKSISYHKLLDKSLTKCLARLISYHIVRIDESLMRLLEDLGTSRVAGIFIYFFNIEAKCMVLTLIYYISMYSSSKN